MPRRRKRARVEVVELPDHDGSDEADDRASSSSDDEQELVIDDALLAQDAPFELRCWSEAIAGATARQLHELCAEAFMAFQGRSFWVPADRSPPTVGDGGWAVLERFAADVYAYHTKGLTGIDIDASRSGAEVWVQVRSGEVADATAAQEQEELLQVTVQPGWSPGSEQVVPTAAGQGVSIVIPSDARPGSTISVAVPVQKPGAGTSINWHFDKDEDLLDECGVYIHPFISTVTYLSEVGAPTVVIGARVTTEGELNGDTDPSDDHERRTEREFDVFASYPVLGKHIAFNGRLLHGCPSSCALPRGPSVSKSTSKLKNKAATVGVGDQRVSLLVNIWLNHKPLGVEPISADPEEPAVPSPKQHSRRAAAAAAKLRSCSVWSLGDHTDALSAAAVPQKVTPLPRAHTAESDRSVRAEGGEGGIPVGGAGQRLMLRLPVADFRRGLRKGKDLFQARLPATVCFDEVQSGSEDELGEDELGEEEVDAQ